MNINITIFLLLLSIKSFATDTDLQAFKSCKQAILAIESEISAINNYISDLANDINNNITDAEYCAEQELALKSAKSKNEINMQILSENKLKLSTIEKKLGPENLKILNDIDKITDINKRHEKFVEQNPDKDPKDFLKTLSQDEIRFIISMEEFLISNR